MDKRADIWAFGVVLYELLTGRKLFSGEDLSDTLAAVIKEEPNWTSSSQGPTAAEALSRKRSQEPVARHRRCVEVVGRAAAVTGGADGAIERRAGSRRPFWWWRLESRCGRHGAPRGPLNSRWCGWMSILGRRSRWLPAQ